MKRPPGSRSCWSAAYPRRPAIRARAGAHQYHQPLGLSPITAGDLPAGRKPGAHRPVPLPRSRLLPRLHWFPRHERSGPGATRPPAPRQSSAADSVQRLRHGSSSARAEWNGLRLAPRPDWRERWNPSASTSHTLDDVLGRSPPARFSAAEVDLWKCDPELHGCASGGGSRHPQRPVAPPQDSESIAPLVRRSWERREAIALRAFRFRYDARIRPGSWIQRRYTHRVVRGERGAMDLARRTVSEGRQFIPSTNG